MKINLKDKLNKNKIELFGILIYIITLQIAYRMIYKENGVWIQNFEVNYSILKTLFSSIIVVVVFLVNEKNTSDYVKLYNKIFIIIMLIPISLIYSVRDFSTLVYLLFVLEFLIMTYGSYLLGKINFRDYINKINLKKKVIDKFNFTNIIYYLFWVVTLFVVFCCFIYNGIPKLTALNLYKVYGVRDQFYLPKYVQYLYNFVTEFIVLFLMVVSLHKKEYKKVVLTIIIQLLFFLWRADKIILFSGPLVLVVYLFISRFEYKKYIEKNIIWSVEYICIFTMILQLFNMNLPLGLFVRRMFIVPANLKFVYVDFFSTHSQLGVVGTIFNTVFNVADPYVNMPYPNVISDIYFNLPEMFSNTGFIVEGFARWGYIGFIIIPIIYIFAMRILERGSRNMTFALMVSMSIIPLIMLNDSFLIPLLTFGPIGLLVITSLFFKIDKLETKKLFNKLRRK